MLAALSLPVVALAVDINGVGVVLPEIRQDLGLGRSATSWVMNASPLAMAAVLMAVGRMTDRVGRRLPLLAGITGFGLGSLVCALAPNGGVLIAGRLVQGFASAVCFTTSLAVVSAVFDDARRARAIGFWGAVMGVGGAVGPLVGGVLTTGAGWRAFFGVNVVLCLVVVPGLAVLVPRDGTANVSPAERHSERFALLALIPGLVLVMVGAQAASRLGWLSAGVLGPIVIGAGLLLVSNRTDRASREPIVPRPVSGDGRFAAANAVGTCANWSFGITLVFVAEWLQSVADLSALRAGLVFVAFSGSFAAAGVFVARFLDRRGARATLAVGAALGAVGLGTTAMLPESGALAVVVVGLVVAGFGLGLVFDGSTTLGIEAVGRNGAGTAAGVLQTSRLVGLVVGIAVSTTLLAAVGGPGPDGLTRGIRAVLLLGAAVSALGAVIALAVARRD